MHMKRMIWVCLALVAIILIVYMISVVTGAGENDSDNLASYEGTDEDIKIAAVGDSITDGFTLPEEETYPAFLSDFLGDGYWVVNFGVNNTTAMLTGDDPYKETEAYRESLEFNPDIVIKMFGLNDSKEVNWNGAEHFKVEYENLIDDYLEKNPDVEMILMTPSKAFNEGNMPGSINNENVTDIVDIVEAIGEDRGYTVIDINQLSKENSHWFEGDMIHPDSDGTKGIAETVYEYIRDE